MIARDIESDLEKWKSSDDRKPLIIRGARQVGKTTVVNKFGETYENFISLNLEKSADVSHFENFDDLHDIFDSILLQQKVEQLDFQDTLLFLDEIQESPKAIKTLRYFYEEMPELHIIAAGSLLEFALKEIKSYPVGRVQFMYLHPVNFKEYLHAMGEQPLTKALENVPVKRVAHPHLMEIYNKYAIIGGMPEVVQKYQSNGKISSIRTIYESIWTAYQEDVLKYADSKKMRRVIRHLIETAPFHLDDRIKFARFGKSNYKSREVKEAFEALDKSGLIKIIYPTVSTSIPKVSDYRKRPRMQFLDTGILNFSIGIQNDMMAMEDLSSAYKGSLIPHLFTQEIISTHTQSRYKPNFWVRQKNQSSAEVDLVVQSHGKLIPIEIKSGKKGKLRSLHQFVDRCDHNYAIRVYGGKYKVEKSKTRKGKEFILMNLPYYLGTQIEKYIEFFLSEY